MTVVRLVLHASSGVAWVIAGAVLLWLSIHRNAPRRAADAWAPVASVALVIVLVTGLWKIVATEGSAVSDEALYLGVALDAVDSATDGSG